MLKRPCLKREWHYFCLDAQSILLISEEQEVALNGALSVLLLPLLDGSRSPMEVASALQERFPRERIYYALLKLQQAGYIYDADAEPQEQRLRVHLHALENISHNAFAEAFEAAGVEVTQAEGLPLVLSEDYLNPKLSAINLHSLQTQTPWLLARLVGKELFLGPYFAPPQTACWECMVYRMRRINPTKQLLCNLREGGRPFTPFLQNTPTSRALATSLLTQWIQERGIEYFQDRIVSVHTTTLETKEHTVIKRPQCPVCGDASSVRGNKDFVLQSRPKAHWESGGHRSSTSEKVLERYRKHISPLCGTVPFLQPVGKPIEGLYAYVSGANYAVPNQKDLHRLRMNLRSSSMGKGTTPLQAQAGAVCEALERFSCVYEGDSSAILGRFSELGEAAIDPRSVLLFSERQYDRREATNDPNEHFNLVPERFNPEECIEWTPIRSLLTGETKYLATRQCWFGYPNERGTKFVNPCSNGCASGNNLEEAILQGLMELIERDGVALWWYNSLKRPQIDMSTFDIPHLKHIAERFRQSANRNLWTLDLTADTGIPTVVAISAMTEGETPHLLFGFGASLDPSIAVSRAVTECYQMYSVQEQHLNVDHRTPLGKSLRETTWESCEFVLPDKTVPARTLTDFEFSPTDDTLQDIHTVVDRLHSLGLETFALDMTRPDVEMAVVRVVVPGLRHFWRRLAPGRLYDVPVKMGWLTSPTTEESVNPMQILM